MREDARLVYVVDDDGGTQFVISRILDSPQIEIRCYGSAEDFISAFEPTDDVAQCMLLDVSLPGMDGLALQDEMRVREIVMPVMFITGVADFGTAVRALHGGAFELIEKPLSKTAVVNCVTRALEADARRREQAQRRQSVERRLQSLSSREQEVMDRLLHGENHKVTAEALGISLKTLLKHRARILKKLDAGNEVELLLLMTEAGLATNSERLELREPAHHS